LGAAQAIVGWFMVKSGLRDNPFVSPVWLSMHLGVAFIIFGLVWWSALSHWCDNSFAKPSSGPKKQTIVVCVVIYLQVLLGAMVAGSDAGLVYNSFPKMNGEWIPDGLWIMQPWYANFLQNVTMIQFTHRLGAYVVTILVVGLSILLLRKENKEFHRIAIALLCVLALQMVLGIKTLLFAVPISLASAHQMVALLLFSLVLLVLHRLYSAGKNPMSSKS
jgi:cytochrome c oxidase assembly protein subunit 15